MLERLLNYIRNDRTVSTAELSRKLGIDIRMVNVLLDELERRGYIQTFRTEIGCKDGSCGECSLSGACDPDRLVLREVKISGL